MTTASTTANGKTSGKTPADKPIVAERPKPAFDYDNVRDLRGADYVRGWECMHLLGIITTAFGQADTCASRASRAVSEAEVRDRMVEALKCVATAEHYARMLLDQIAVCDPRIGSEPDF